MSLCSDDETRPAEGLEFAQSDLDLVLALQLAIAWAGEAGETERLGWWQSELISEWGGEDLFQRLMPETWRWATFQAARASAIRVDRALRMKAHNPDAVLSLFSLGVEVDERLNERLSQLKAAAAGPLESLPLLKDCVHDSWDRRRFETWLEQFPALDSPATSATPLGRRISAPARDGLDGLVRRLAGALRPLPAAYPLPYVERPR